MLKYIAVLLLVAITMVAGRIVVSIEVDAPTGQIYVVDAGTSTSKSVLYEIDNVAVTQNMAHYMPAGSVEYNSLFIKKAANKRRLYALQYADATGLSLDYFKAPLGNQVNLPPQASSVIGGSYISTGTLYDAVDNILVAAVSRNLTLVDLNSLITYDSFRYFVASRTFGYNLVYNHNNNRLIVFKSRVPVGAGAIYGLSVDEFDLTTKKFVSVDTTYNCLCDTNPETSPFYQTVLEAENCEIDYPNNKLWCAHPEGKRFFAFQADNLAHFSIITTAAAFDHVAYDFKNKFIYALDANDETGGVGYTASKINLSNGNVVATITDASTSIDPTVLKLDSEEPHLYVAVYSLDETVPAKIVTIKTNSFTAKTLTLTTAGYL